MLRNSVLDYSYIHITTDFYYLGSLGMVYGEERSGGEGEVLRYPSC